MITDTKYQYKIEDAKGKLSTLNKVKNPNYQDQTNIKSLTYGRALFTKRPEYDLTESYRIADTECFVSTTIRKKKSLILKNGFNFISKNNEDVEYLKTRLNEIAYVTEYNLDRLLNEVVTSILHNHNAFICIARSEKSSSGLVRAIDNNLKPISGYFPLAETNIKLLENEYREVIGYNYHSSPRTYLEFLKQDVIHIALDKKPNINIGTPPLEAVKDDIKSLRQIEENLERLIYKMTVPLIHAVVGTDNQPAGVDLATGLPETEVLNDQLMYMEDAGSITTTHRVELKMLGAESQALRLAEPLAYYKNRVLVGLVISDVDLGTGTTTTGGAASVVSEALQQDVEMYQKVIEDVITHQILTPLLLEKSTNINKQYLTEDEKVYFKFNNTNMDSKIKNESHLINQFNAKLITREEYRSEVGRDPLTDGEKGDIFDDIGTLTEGDKLKAEQAMAKATLKASAIKSGKSTTAKKTTKPSQSSQPTSNYTNPTNQHTKNQIKDSCVDTVLQKELKLRHYVDCLLLGKTEMAITLLTNKLIEPIMEEGYNEVKDSTNSCIDKRVELEATARSLTTTIVTHIMPTIKDRVILMDAAERFIIGRLTK